MDDTETYKKTVLVHLDQRLAGIGAWLVGQDMTELTAILARQMIQDEMRDTDEKFGSDMVDRYFPFVYAASSECVSLAFTNADADPYLDGGVTYFGVEAIEPFSWEELVPPPAGEDWPKSKLTIGADEPWKRPREVHKRQRKRRTR